MHGDENECPNDDYHAPYIQYIIGTPLIIIVQLILLANFFYFDCYKANGGNMKLSYRLLFLLLQMVALIWTITDLWRYVIDPLHPILGHLGCVIAMTITTMTPFMYYPMYCFFVLLRLDNSFSGSFLALKARTFWCFTVVIIGAPCAVLISVLSLNRPSLCRRIWKPSDAVIVSPWLHRHQFTKCDLYIEDDRSFFVFYAGNLAVASVNVALAVIFYIKLKKLLSNQGKDNSGHVHHRMEALNIKLCILTMVGVLSSVVLSAVWGLWRRWVGDGTLQMDLVVNSVCIALMFSYNQRYYARFCKCCIRLFSPAPNRLSRVQSRMLSLSHRQQQNVLQLQREHRAKAGGNNVEHDEHKIGTESIPYSTKINQIPSLIHQEISSNSEDDEEDADQNDDVQLRVAPINDNPLYAPGLYFGDV